MKDLIKKIFSKIENLIRKFGLFILIMIFIYMAVMITKLNSSIERANKSINYLMRNNNSEQSQGGIISIQEMMDSVNFRHEFDNLQYALEDLKDTLDIVEINTRTR